MKKSEGPLLIRHALIWRLQSATMANMDVDVDDKVNGDDSINKGEQKQSLLYCIVQ